MKNGFGKSKKNILLSAVALVLVMMLTISVTYSWIEDIRLVEIKEDDEHGNPHPLSVGGNIDAEYEINTTDNAVHLGLYDWDNESNSVNQKKRDNEYKGYFYESGDMHLSPCYSNGESFYFPKSGASGYRLGNHDDEDVNYISTTLAMYCTVAKTEFWFDSLPSIVLKDADGTTLSDSSHQAYNYLRFSVTIDGSTTIYSKNGSCNTVASTTASSTQSVSARKFAEYTYGDTENDGERGKNGNTLFSIPKYDSTTKEKKVVNFKIWLEKSQYTEGITVSDIDIKLVSSCDTDKTRKIYLNDKTHGTANSSWVTNNSARMYMFIPALDPSGWYTADKNPHPGWKELTVNDNTSYFEIPAIYMGETMYVVRTNSHGYKNNNTNESTYVLGGNDSGLSGKNVYGWNYWESELPETYQDETYTLYGNSYDNTISGVINGDRTYEDENGASHTYSFSSIKPYQGNGTWGEMMKIRIKNSSTAGSNSLRYNNDATTRVYIEDYSELISQNKVYVYIMYCTNKNGNKDTWEANVPATSTKISFYYKGEGSGGQRHWGYSAQGPTGKDDTDIKTSYSYSKGYERNKNASPVEDTYFVSGTFGSEGRGGGQWGNSENEPEQNNNNNNNQSSGTDSLDGYTEISKYVIYYGSGTDSKALGNCKYKTENQTTYYKQILKDVTSSGISINITDASNNTKYAVDNNSTGVINISDYNGDFDFLTGNSLKNVTIKSDSATSQDYIIKFHENGQTLRIDSILLKAS